MMKNGGTNKESSGAGSDKRGGSLPPNGVSGVSGTSSSGNGVKNGNTNGSTGNTNGSTGNTNGLTVRSNAKNGNPGTKTPSNGAVNNTKGTVNSQTNNRRPPVKRKKRTALGIAVVALLVMITAAISLTVAFFLMYKPKLETDVPFQIQPKPNGDSGGQTAESGEAPDDGDDKEFGGRNLDIVNFLFAGLDADGGNHTDVIIIASFDTKNKKIAMMSIPRDTYINIGRNFNKINSLFTGEYNRAILDGKRGDAARHAAMEGLSSLVEQNMNVQIDHWVLLNLEGFRNIVDMFGGVEIEIAERMYYTDPDQDLVIDLLPGKQILDGEKSEHFVRFRDSYAIPDKGRINAQKVFITALMSSVKRNLNLSTVTKLVSEVSTNMLTTLNAADIVYFAKEAWSVDMGGITMLTLPGEGVRNSFSGAWYEVMYRADTLDIINKYFNVYDTPVTEEIFDAARTFTNTGEEYIDKIYRTAKSTLPYGSTADKIEDDMMAIQRESFGIFE